MDEAAYVISKEALAVRAIQALVKEERQQIRVVESVEDTAIASVALLHGDEPIRRELRCAKWPNHLVHYLLARSERADVILYPMQLLCCRIDNKQLRRACVP